MDYYRLLECDPKASSKVIHAAYRALAEVHKNNDDRMKKINEAKEVLLDDTKRANYDGRKGKVKAGKVVGEYRILDKIAEGGFGTTYKAEHITTGCKVCIKHALEISAADEEMLLNEAKLIWDLRHWGIPAVRDIIRMDDNSIALVMSYVPGPTLAEIREMRQHEDGIDAEHVAWMTERILNILRYLHLNGIVHGDMKPQNVIVQPTDHTVVLVDYGLSLVRPTARDATKGYTPYFAAPEQLAGKHLLPETDFYGLGMTMIFALGGDIDAVKVPSSTPDAMVGFIKKLIKRDIRSRPNWDTEDLCESIQQVRRHSFGRAVSGMKPLEI